jgi:hypothetical protein
MRQHRVAACAVTALFAEAVLGGELFKPTLDFNDMRVVVKYVSTGELVNQQKKNGARIDHREIRQSYRHGLSILRKSPLPKGKRPREVDDEVTLSLGHELLHCMSGDYHR